MLIFKSATIAIIKFYQYCVSPIFPPSCRFEPTCSHYMIVAIQKHGVTSGIWLGLRRLLRCHPGCSAGYDPVPEPKEIVESK